MIRRWARCRAFRNYRNYFRKLSLALYIYTASTIFVKLLQRRSNLIHPRILYEIRKKKRSIRAHNCSAADHFFRSFNSLIYFNKTKRDACTTNFYITQETRARSYIRAIEIQTNRGDNPRAVGNDKRAARSSIDERNPRY